MLDLETRTPEQLPEAASVPPGALTIIQQPGGPVQKVEAEKVFNQFLSVATAKETRAELNADLAHVAGTLAVVYGDADLFNIGYYRKEGAAGAGGWIMTRLLEGRPGPAGADATQLGTFAEAQGADIPAPIRVVRLTDRGKPLYERVAAEPAHPAKFQSADGGWWDLSRDQVITPFMFGAVGAPNYIRHQPDLATDDSDALQAFFDFVTANRCEMINRGGVFGITKNIIQGGDFGEDENDFSTSYIFDGHMTLVVKANIAGAALRIRNMRGSVHDPIVVTSADRYSNWAGRLFDWGVLVEDKSNRQVFASVEAEYARLGGMITQTDVIPGRLANPQPKSDPALRTESSNTHANILLNSWFLACGSGSLHAGSFLNANFWDKTNTTETNDVFPNGSGSYGQRTVMNVDVLPPAEAEDRGIPIYVIVAGDLYHVRQVDRVNGKVAVFPWIDLSGAVGATGTLQYVTGGGFLTQGGDTSTWTAKVNATNCAQGLVLASLYNGHFDACLQHNLINIAIGVGAQSSALGGTLKCYIEFQQSPWDLVWNATSNPQLGYFKIESFQSLDFGRIKKFDVRYSSNGVRNQVVPGLQIDGQSRMHSFENVRDINGRYSEVSIGFDRKNGDVIPLEGDHCRIDVFLPAPGTHHLGAHYGYRAQTVQATGNGPNNATTSITIRPRAGSGQDLARTINGGPPGENLVLTGYKGLATIQVAMDIDDPNNILVTEGSGRIVPGAAVADTSGADAAGIEASLNALKAALRASGALIT